METLDQRKEKIRLLMTYAVPRKEMDEALALVEKHGNDLIALNVFEHFYSFLPEAREDRIRLLRQLARRQGTFLICATTGLDDYLYLVTTQAAEFLGRHEEGIWDKEVLNFFGFKSRQAALAAHRDLRGFPVYVPALLDHDLCPVCLVKNGEFHTPGCPVEVCPWCGGQLTVCDCRFQQLGREVLDREAQLDAFLEKLAAKGRVPFDAARHRPAYPAEKSSLQGQDDS